MLLISTTFLWLQKCGSWGFILFKKPYFHHMELTSASILACFLSYVSMYESLTIIFEAITLCLSVLQIWTNLILIAPYEVDTIIIPILKMGKLRHTVTQRSTDSQDSNQVGSRVCSIATTLDCHLLNLCISYTESNFVWFPFILLPPSLIVIFSSFPLFSISRKLGKRSLFTFF